MSANFWTSTHCKNWLIPREKLEEAHKLDIDKLGLTRREIEIILHHFSTQIQELGKRDLLQLRQRVISSAIVYLRRFYAKNSFCHFCPRLVSCTCLYIATKVEECSSQAPAYRFEREIKKIDPTWPYNTNHILECEFYVLEALNFQLIVYHPYRPLQQMVDDCTTQNSYELLNTAWSHVNDSYSTDLSLLYPPYIIALGCLYLASELENIDLRVWFSELSVEIKEVWNVVNVLLDFYGREVENEETVNAALRKLPIFQKFINSTQYQITGRT